MNMEYGNGNFFSVLPRMALNSQLPPTPAESVSSCLNDEYHNHMSSPNDNPNSSLANQFEELYPEFTPDSFFSDLNGFHNPYPEQHGGSPNGFIAEADFGYDLRSGAFHDRDEDPLTPARLRRRAQNRAAQRAYRQRKENLIQTLEQKLIKLEFAYSGVCSENGHLKHELQQTRDEIQRLRAEKIQRTTAAPSTSPLASRKSMLLDSTWGFDTPDALDGQGAEGHDTGQGLGKME